MAPPTFRTIFVPLVLLSFFGHAQASQQGVAVFNFELVDTSLEGQVNGPRPDEQHRLSDVAKEFRKRLAESGAYVPVDISEIADQVHRSNLQACGGMRYEIGATGRAELAITGVVHKISNLILNMSIYVRDSRDGHLVRQMAASFRGNTDHSWSRALDWLVRNRLLAPRDGAVR